MHMEKRKMTTDLLWFTSSSGRIELQMTMDQAQRAFHQGECDRDVRGLATDSAISAQLAAHSLAGGGRYYRRE